MFASKKLYIPTFIFSFLVIFLFMLPKSAFAATCDKFTSFTSEKVDTNKYKISGSIANCVNKDALELILDAKNENNNLPFIGFKTDGSGSFSIPVSFPHQDTYTVSVQNADTATVQGSPNTLTITIASEKKYKCGDVIPQDDPTLCQDGCTPSQNVTGHIGVWACGNPTDGSTNAVPTPTSFLPICNSDLTQGGKCAKVDSSIGLLDTNINGLVTRIVQVTLGLSGGIFLLLIIRAGYRMISSQGNPEAIKDARESLTSAIVGFLFLIFSFVILELIGVHLLQLPGLS